MSKYPRDLLQRVMSNDMSHDKYEEEANEDKEEQEIELNLGLSLGGRFGVDKTKLVRSSSIALTFPFFREDSKNDESFAAGGLKRTASLPAETTEEDWPKKKELQTLRRLAAKRRRSEKQWSTTTAAGNDKEEEEVGPSSAAAVIKTIPLWSVPKGKIVILGRSSSGLSELESKPFQGSSCGGEARGPASNHDQQTNHGTALCSLNSLTPENASRISRAVMESMRKKPPIPSEDKGRDSQMNHMADMPCVFTKGDGPNGRKIDGILYRYAKGEEVRIMCVCHGTFLSPAEFVKHAGGGDVPNPLRHIVVNPAATSFL